MMKNKVVDNHQSKTLSKVKLHEEFIYVLSLISNRLGHTDSAVNIQHHANLHGIKSGHCSTCISA